MTDADPLLSNRRLRVLVVDDQPSCRALAVAFAESQGHSVESASNGREALAAIARKPFDVVLMDVAMPELDGIEATRIIRRTERETGTHTRIVALTAGSAADRDSCLAAGMDEYVTKPVSQAQLTQALAPNRAPGPVLVVEDNEAVREALAVFLVLRGYDVVTADNGAEALSLLQSLTVPPSLILLDLIMPIMDGRHFRKLLLTEYPDFAAIPLIVISACGELINPRSLAAMASLSKPFDPDELLAIVAEHCVRKRKPARTEQARNTSSGPARI